MFIYKQLDGIAPDIFVELVNSIIEGNVIFGDDFNYAILCCIPKAPDELSDDGTPVFRAGSTRPISIVDAANRIVAAVLQTSLERCVGNRFLEIQRGFLADRKVLMNLIDLDFAAQKISIKPRRGAVILFNFRAAFPSMDDQFIWDTLEKAGIPTHLFWQYGLSTIRTSALSRCRVGSIMAQRYSAEFVRAVLFQE